MATVTTMDDLPDEIIELILGELDHIADRIAAHCVCRLWRERLAQARRYAWALCRTDLWAVAVCALENGKWSATSWLLDGRDQLSARGNRLLLAATRADNADAVAWLRARGCKWTPDLAAKAIAEGHKKVIDQARDDGHLCHKDVLCALAQIDDTETLQSIACLSSSALASIIRAATASGSVAVLRWLYERDASWATPDEAKRIILKGHLRTVVWAVEEAGMTIDSQWLYTALEKERLDTVVWFHRAGSNGDKGAESRFPDATRSSGRRSDRAAPTLPRA
ncbi:F-box domain protein [Pandoravirus inopinatum]|uniref:F-box domain protein n=1 Tax=Pandoravirus inopinatum TaxID=1605721 RepID=A0A0B5JC25_9VIRU|nr:F-box domain protein [Pandoravirus inopinatum]AJF97137.1 F-box domain protein [Pandoravirus inopinatum]